MAKKAALGKGLNALLPAIGAGSKAGGKAAAVAGVSPAANGAAPLGAAAGTAAGAAVRLLDISKIEPNPDQPRRAFSEDDLNQLADSIRSVGVVQPILVTDEGGFFRIVAGERRWRAARIAGLAEVPAIVRALTEQQRMEIALIENLQRRDLNPIEEANGYNRLLSEYGYTQDALAKAIGKSRPAITNAIRLLKLPERVRGLIEQDKLSPGHARAILALEGDEEREALAEEILDKGWSVRETEGLVNSGAFAKRRLAQAGGRGAGKRGGLTGGASGGTGLGGGTAPKRRRGLDAASQKIEESLLHRFDTRVTLSRKGGAGRIVFEYYSEDELQQLLEKFGIAEI